VHAFLEQLGFGDFVSAGRAEEIGRAANLRTLEN
jgi:hypothetical protein